VSPFTRALADALPRRFGDVAGLDDQRLVDRPSRARRPPMRFGGNGRIGACMISFNID
jgi:hypothetical protein